MEKIKKISSILIKNGKVVTEKEISINDVFCSNGIIEFIGDSFDIKDRILSSTEIIDAKHKYIIPGGIDPHVHFDLPIGNGMKSSDSFETGSEAAIYGGTTTIIDFVTPQRGESLLKCLKNRKKEAEKSLCNYRLHMSITEWNDKTESEMKDCVYNEGIKSFKVYMAYKDSIGLDETDIFKVMKVAEAMDSIVMVHCEDGDRIDELKKGFENNGKKEIKYHYLSRPPETEADAVKKLIEISKKTNCKTYIVHNSTKFGLDNVKAYGKNGRIFVETCPHYLLLDNSIYENKGFDEAANYVMSPPLRSKEHQDALWDGIKTNIIDVIATDHCPFNKKDRLAFKKDGFSKIPNGVGSVENRLSLLYTYGVLTKKINIEKFVNLISTNPAKIFGIYPQKGVIKVGSDSDLVIWNPDKKSVISTKTQEQRCDTNIFEGFGTRGKAEIVLISDKMYEI